MSKLSIGQRALLQAALAVALAPSAQLTPDELLPKADCERCKYRQGRGGAHCYMFQEKPGDRCGQFTAANAELSRGTAASGGQNE